MLSTFDHLIKVACYLKKVNNVFNIKSSRSKLVQQSSILTKNYQKTMLIVCSVECRSAVLLTVTETDVAFKKT